MTLDLPSSDLLSATAWSFRPTALFHCKNSTIRHARAEGATSILGDFQRCPDSRALSPDSVPRHVAFARAAPPQIPPNMGSSAGRPCNPRGSRAPHRAAVAQDLSRGIVTGHGAHAAAGMRGGAALIEAADRAAVVGIVRHRPLPEQLLSRKLAVEDVAVWRADDPLDVGRCQHLHADDAAGEARRVLVDLAQHVLGEGVLLGLPDLVLERVGRMPAA